MRKRVCTLPTHDYAASFNFTGAFILREALFAASCSALESRWAYLWVTEGSECPRICCTSYKDRPLFTRNEAN